MMNILLAGYIAIEATHKLIQNEKPALSCRFSNRFINLCDKMTEDVCLNHNDLVTTLKDAGFSILEEDIIELSDMGIYGSLWELAEINGCGISVTLDRISVRQETIEIFEFLDINPYTYPSKGAFLIRTEKAYELRDMLLSKGIEASVIGVETSANDRIIINQDEIRYLTPVSRLLKDEQGLKNYR